MKLRKWLKITDVMELKAAIYIENEEDPIWKGSAYYIPWWLADLEIADPTLAGEPISFRTHFDEDDNPGVIICLKDEEM